MQWFIEESMTWIISSLNWIARNNPVITNVDECNKAEIVVGAFIELINHDAIGSWADLIAILGSIDFVLGSIDLIHRL
jgi:NADH:ubiquinone oxidoreductase subunit D